MNDADLLVRMNGIRKAFPRRGLEEAALRGVSLEVRRGEYVCVSGPSGSGKSTLLSIIGFLDDPSSGEYTFRGRDTRGLSDEEKGRLRNRELGIVFQNFNLVSSLTVAENVELPLVYRGMRAVERKRLTTKQLAAMNLSGHRDQYPDELSGGEQQRVAVARALVGGPTLVLADEPTGNLDQENGDAIMGLLAEANRAGATILLVTHDPRFANVATRTIHLKDGAVEA